MLSGIAVLSFAVAAAVAPPSPTPAPAPGRAVQIPHEPTITSEIFVLKATMAGLYEVEAGKLALMRSKNPDVRAYAQRMVTEHNAAGVELTRLVSTKTYSLPNALLLDVDHQAKLRKLEKTSDRNFDATYGRSMMEGHDEALNAFMLASTETLVDSDLRTFASRMLPTLQAHHELALKLPKPAAD
jgi:putative membrane protein